MTFMSHSLFWFCVLASISPTLLIFILQEVPTAFLRRAEMSNPSGLPQLFKVVLYAVGSYTDAVCQSPAGDGRLLAQQDHDLFLGSFLGSFPRKNAVEVSLREEKFEP